MPIEGVEGLQVGWYTTKCKGTPFPPPVLYCIVSYRIVFTYVVWLFVVWLVKNSNFHGRYILGFVIGT